MLDAKVQSMHAYYQVEAQLHQKADKKLCGSVHYDVDITAAPRMAYYCGVVDTEYDATASATHDNPYDYYYESKPSSAQPHNSDQVELPHVQHLVPDINEQFQQLLASKPQNTADCIAKARAILAITEQFARIATTIGKTIISEAHLPDDRKTIRPLNVGGIAGGTKFSANGIFFKFTRDDRNIYGDDEYAMKSANHELRSLGKLIEHGAHLGLHFPLVMLLDYLGLRLFASATLPLAGTNTLVYGSMDQAKTVHRSVPEMNAMMASAIGSLNLKEHRVGRGPLTSVNPVSLYGPADIEGHRGLDGRFYVLDVARLFPPLALTRNIHALLLPANAHEHVQDLALEWQPPIPREKVTFDHAVRILDARRASAIDNTPLRGRITHKNENEHSDENNNPYSTAFDEHVSDSHRATQSVVLPLAQFPARLVWLANSAGSSVNERASGLLGRQVLGDAVLVANGYLGRHLWRLMRPEAVARQPQPLSSDAFTGFGLHDKTIDNAGVAAATQWIVCEAIPALAAALDRGEEVIGPTGCRVDNGVAALLHRKGINLRFLGMVATCVQRKTVRSLLLVEMCTRVCKSLLKREMRSTRMPKETALEFFNLVLGNSPQSTGFWEHHMPVWLRLMFPLDARECVDMVDSESTAFASYTNLRGEIMKDALLQSLQLSTGIVVAMETQQKFHSNPTLFEQVAPFHIDDITINEQTKKLSFQPIIEQLIEQCLDEYCSTESFDPVVRLRRRTELVAEVFGPCSAEAAVCHLRMAERLLMHKDDTIQSAPMAQIKYHLDRAYACIQHCEEVSAEFLIGYLYVEGCYYSALSEWQHAYESFLAALKVSETFFGDGEPGGVGHGHPIGVVLVSRLAELTSDRYLNLFKASFRFSVMFEHYMQQYPLVPCSRDAIAAIFGSRDPFALRGVVKPDPSVGLDDSRVVAWRQLVDVIDTTGRLKTSPSILVTIRQTALAEATTNKTQSSTSTRTPSTKVIHSTPCVAEGGLYIFGVGRNGGMHFSELFVNQTVPCKLPFPTQPVICIACTARHVVFSTPTGVYSFGSQLYGCLGNGSFSDSSVMVPVDIPQLCPSNIGGAVVIKIAVGDRHNVALTNTGDVFVWGKNADGQLGRSNFADSAVPCIVDHTEISGIARDVACGRNHTLVVNTRGEVLSCGRGASSALGHGSYTISLTSFHKIQALDGIKIAAVAACDHASIALSDGGNGVWTWGTAQYGELGHGSYSPSPQQEECREHSPRRVDALTNIAIRSVHALANTAYAVTYEGGMYAWGKRYGSVPVAVPVNGAKVISVAPGETHAIAITHDGAILGWGACAWGQLGNGKTYGSVSVPTAVGDAALQGLHAVHAAANVGFSIVAVNASSAK